MIYERDRRTDGQTDRRHMTAKAALDASIARQKVYPPCSADTVCPRLPLMTQVQHWAKVAQTDHVTLRP